MTQLGNPAAMYFSDHVLVVILLPILIPTDSNGYRLQSSWRCVTCRYGTEVNITGELTGIIMIGKLEKDHQEVIQCSCDTDRLCHSGLFRHLYFP